MKRAYRACCDMSATNQDDFVPTTVLRRDQYSNFYRLPIYPIDNFGILSCVVIMSVFFGFGLDTSSTKFTVL